MEQLITKYKPKKTRELTGQEYALTTAKKYLETYKTHKKKALLLHGPPGVGKTTLAYALAGDHNWEVVEVNASDVRNKDAIETYLGSAMKQQSLFSAGKLILIDEADGLSGRKDRGGAKALAQLIQQTNYPVIITANNGYSDKLKELRKISIVCEVKPLEHTEIREALQKITKQENINIEETVLKTLARRAGGDMRGALTDLQTLRTHKHITKESLSLLGERRQAETIIQAIHRIFKTTNPQYAREALDAIDENLDELQLWIEYNLPKEYTKAEDLKRAFEALSRADVFNGRVRRWQHYRFMVYIIDELTCGVSLAKQERYIGETQYKQSTKPLTYWRANMTRAKKESIARKIAEKTKTSMKQAIQELPYITHILQYNKNIQEEFELEDDEVSWLVKKLNT